MTIRFRRILIFSLCVLIPLIFVSCNYGFFWGLVGEENVDDRSSSMTSLEVYKPSLSNISGDEFCVLVMTDLHFGASWGEDNEDDFLDWFEKRISAYKNSSPEKIPQFIVNLGDTADGGHDSEFKDYVVLENKIKQIAKEKLGDSDYKIYSILGNHDLYNNGVDGFEEMCFPFVSSYYFHVGGFGFYFLDTANGTLGEAQLKDFKEKISADSSPKIVFSHYPIYAGAGKYILMRIHNNLERNLLLTYFAKYNVKRIYDGHAHKRIWFDFSKFQEEVIDSFRHGQAAVFTVNSSTGSVTTEIVEF